MRGVSKMQMSGFGKRYIFATSYRDIDGLWPFETSFNVVLYFRSSLTEIRPFLGRFEVAMFVGPLTGPDDAS